MYQEDLFDKDSELARVDQRLVQSKLNRSSHDFRELLDFVTRLRNLSPFNGMLLNIQKPGLTDAASARDWEVRFGRTVSAGARHLVILKPFGPVGLVRDVQGTEGRALPKDVDPYHAVGSIVHQRNRSRISSVSATMSYGIPTPVGRVTCGTTPP
jgi:hypothetical protein